MKKLRQTLVLASALLIGVPQLISAQAQSRGYTYRTAGGFRLSGTYQVDDRRSDDPRVIVTRATRTLPPGRRDRVYDNWIERLDSPETISLDVRGRSVTIASSNAPQITFYADGRDRTEEGEYGRTITTRAEMRGNQLVVSTFGNRGNDFTVTFEPVGNDLRVTRRLDSQFQQTSLTVQSVYRRVGDARWNVYNEGRRVLVPPGTQLTAQLSRPLSSRTVREGERISLTVVGNGPFDGATIDGVVGRRDAQGRTNLVFDFDHIWLRNGRSGEFEGQIDAVRMPDGTVVRVDRTGNVQERNRSGSQTAQSGAVGAAIGAIIGAIAGGGKGAVIGAVAGGAGMILIDSRNGEINLPAGTEFTISTIGPPY